MNDHDAHLAQVQSKEQTIRDAHAARKEAKLLSAQLERERHAKALWRKAYWTCMAVLLVIIIYAFKTF